MSPHLGIGRLARWTRRAALVVVAAALASACDNSNASGDAGLPEDAAWPETYCPGAQPDWAECTPGTFYRECGGVGPPLFACGFDGIAGTACSWFPGGCVPAGWRPSACPADNICCVDNYPYPRGALSSWTPTEDFSRYGTRPWNRTRNMDVTATIDADVSAVETALTCEGFSDSFNPCTNTHANAARIDDMLYLSFAGRDWTDFAVSVLVDARPSPPTARACLHPVIDAFPAEECPAWIDIDCGDGEVTLNRMPAQSEGPYNLDDVRASVDLVFPGRRITGTISVHYPPQP